MFENLFTRISVNHEKSQKIKNLKITKTKNAKLRGGVFPPIRYQKQQVNLSCIHFDHFERPLDAAHPCLANQKIGVHTTEREHRNGLEDCGESVWIVDSTQHSSIKIANIASFHLSYDIIAIICASLRRWSPLSWVCRFFGNG
jgi:hypothetical protein